MFPIWNWQFGWWIVVFLIFWRQRCQDHWLLLRLSSALKLLEWRSPSLIDQKNPRFCRLQWSSCSHLSWFLLLGLSQRDWRRLFMICCRASFWMNLRYKKMKLTILLISFRRSITIFYETLPCWWLCVRMTMIRSPIRPMFSPCFLQNFLGLYYALFLKSPLSEDVRPPNPIGVQKILKSPHFRPESPDIQMMMIKFPSLDSQNLPTLMEINGSNH